MYRTKQGDMWDYISWLVYGDEYYVKELYRANPQFLEIYIFPDGCDIYCPELETGMEEDGNIPDWRDENDLESEDLYDTSGLEEG